MSNPELIATLGLKADNFRAGLTASEQGLKQLDTNAKSTAAQIALLEQAMRGGGSREQIGQLDALRAKLRDTQVEYKNTERQLKALQAVQSAPVTMPASRPMATVQQFASAAEAGGAGIDRNGKAALFHSAKAGVEMMAAGQSPLRALEVEAPRIIGALGPAIVPLLPVLATLATALAGAAAAASVHKAENEARPIRRETGRIASQDAGDAKQYEEVALETQEQSKKVREVRKKRGRIAKIVGAGINGKDEAEARGKADMAAYNLGNALDREADREQREFDGDPQAAHDKLVEERDAQIAAARRKHRGGGDAALHRRQALINKANQDYELAKKKLERSEADRATDLEATRDTNTAREEGLNIGVEGPAIQARAARAKLEHGAKLGPEHETNREAVRAADLAAGDAERSEKTRAAGVAAEARILQIKREGFDVEKRIAQERVNAAQVALDNSRAKVGAEHDALVLAVTAAKAEIQAAEQVTREKMAHAAIDERVAGLRGSSAQVRRATLGVEQMDLIREGASPDVLGDQAKAAANRAALARNKQQRDEFEKAERLRAIDTRSTEDHATVGRGPAAQVGYLDRELARNKERQGWNKTENGNDPATAAHLLDLAHSLLKEKEDIEHASKRELTASEAVTNEMRLRKTGHEYEANLTSIRATYEEKIAGYLRDGKTDLAQQAGIQRDMAIEAEKLAKFRRGAAGEANERNQSQADARDTKAMHAKEKRDVEAKRRRFEDDNRASLPVDPTARAAAIAKGSGTADYVPPVAGADDGTKTKEAAGNIQSPSFDELRQRRLDQRFQPDGAGGVVPVGPDAPEASSGGYQSGLGRTASPYITDVKASAETAFKGDGAKFNHQAIVDAVHGPAWAKDGPPDKWFKCR